MINEIKSDADTRMKKSIEAFKTALSKIRTGRAHPSLLDDVCINYYGTPTPIKQVANIGVEEGRTLTVSPWEKHLVPDVEKAIMASDLGLNPSTSGDLIRLPLPPLTEETRKELTKVVRAEAENAKIALRNVRRDANGDLKELLKEKEISEDEERKGEEDIQKITDKHVKGVDELTVQKEKELMEI